MDRTADTTDDLLRAILRDVLGLDPARAAAIDADTPLFGAISFIIRLKALFVSRWLIAKCPR